MIWFWIFVLLRLSLLTSLSVRTPGTGLYANLAKYDIPYPEAIFNVDYFSDNPHPFFSLAKELYPGYHRPNYVHYFIRTLHQKGLLLRMYTQNIDGLEKCKTLEHPVNKLMFNNVIFKVVPYRIPLSVRYTRWQARGGSWEFCDRCVPSLLYTISCRGGEGNIQH